MYIYIIASWNGCTYVSLWLFAHCARVVARRCVCCRSRLQSLTAGCCYRNCTCNASNAMQGLPHNAMLATQCKARPTIQCFQRNARLAPQYNASNAMQGSPHNTMLPTQCKACPTIQCFQRNARLAPQYNASNAMQGSPHNALQ